MTTPTQKLETAIQEKNKTAIHNAIIENTNTLETRYLLDIILHCQKQTIAIALSQCDPTELYKWMQQFDRLTFNACASFSLDGDMIELFFKENAPGPRRSLAVTQVFSEHCPFLLMFSYLERRSEYLTRKRDFLNRKTTFIDILKAMQANIDSNQTFDQNAWLDKIACFKQKGSCFFRSQEFYNGAHNLMQQWCAWGPDHKTTMLNKFNTFLKNQQTPLASEIQSALEPTSQNQQVTAHNPLIQGR